MWGFPKIYYGEEKFTNQAESAYLEGEYDSLWQKENVCKT